jgi:hypothetical protein
MARITHTNHRRIADLGRLVFFFEVCVEDGTETRRGAQGFATVVQRQILHVERIDAAGRGRVDHNGDGTAGSAFTKGEAAAAGETRVSETFQHRLHESYYNTPETLGSVSGASRRVRYNSALISFSNTAFGARPMCFWHTRPSRLMMNEAGMPHSGPYASCTSSRPRPRRIG